MTERLVSCSSMAAKTWGGRVGGEGGSLGSGTSSPAMLVSPDGSLFCWLKEDLSIINKAMYSVFVRVKDVTYLFIG